MKLSNNKPMERWNNQALLLLIWPLMVEQLLAVTIGMADTVMVASIGEAAVSGVSLVDSVNFLLITAFASFATGGAVVASQYIGRGQPKDASENARQLMYGITLLSLVMMMVALLLRRPLLQLVYGHIQPDVMQAAETYLWLSAVSYPFLAVYSAGAALFRSMGNSRVSMLIALAVNLLNIGGNAVLIYGLKMGVAGAATSTLISRMVAAVVILLLLMKGSGAISLRGLFKPKINWAMQKNILKIGIPNGLENSMFHIGKLLVARIVSQFGTAAIAGNALAIVLATFGNLPGAAVGLGILTVVGQCVGAGDYVGARLYTKKLMKVAYVSMGIVDISVVIFARPLLGLFGLSADATEIAVSCLVLHCGMAIFFWARSFALPNALRAAGDVRFTMLVSMLSMWIFRIGASFIFAYGFKMGVFGVWMAMVLDWMVRGTVTALRWRSDKWEHKKVIK